MRADDGRRDGYDEGWAAARDGKEKEVEEIYPTLF